MAKAKKPSAKNKASVERDKFMVRLPERYRGLLQKAIDKSRRTLTAEVQVALDKHFAGEGVA